MASSTYDAKSKNIGELIGVYADERLVVPEFQRGYSWKKAEIEALWGDIERFEADENQTKYFLGPIVTLPNEAGEILYLLDGQQRLATTIIFLSVIRDMAETIGTNEGGKLAEDIQNQLIKKETGAFTLEMGETDEVYFRDTIQRSPVEVRKATLRTHVNIKDARKILWDQLTSLTAGANEQGKLTILRSKRATLSKNLILANIPVASEDDAFQIFETLNARGLRLAPPDLLLNYLMRKATPTTDRKQIRELWTGMVEQMARRDMFRFLHAYWVSKYGDLKATNLFVALKKRIEADQMNSLEFTKACGEECEKYNDLLRLDAGVLKTATPFVKALVQLNVQSAIPLLLSCFNQKVDISEFEQVCKYMLVFVARYSIFAGLGNSGLEDVFFALARDVREVVDQTPVDQKAKVAKHVKATLADKGPSDPTIEANLKKLILTHGEAMYVVNRIADHMQSGTKEVGMREANLEHIYPKNPEEGEWGGEAGQNILNPVLWHIGNLTWLGARLNDGLRNSEYGVKQEKYREASELVINQTIAEQYAEWNEANIVDRASKLQDVINEIWNFDNPSRV